MIARALSRQEQPLLVYLYGMAGLPVDIDSIRVESMQDGGMGSFRIAPFSIDRKLGQVAAECQFFDEDKILVSAALNLDEHGIPFEIDVWKVDFSPLSRWPEMHEIIGGVQGG